MREQAAETERRTDALIDTLEGKKTAIRDMARETKSEAVDMMKTYLEGEEEALDGFEFLSMAEAGELCHWEIVEKIANTHGERRGQGARGLGGRRPASARRDRAPGVSGARGRRGEGDGLGLGLVRIAGEREPERVALAAAVARQHLAERPLQLGDERRAVLGWSAMSPAIPNDGRVTGPAASVARSR